MSFAHLKDLPAFCADIHVATSAKLASFSTAKFLNIDLFISGSKCVFNHLDGPFRFLARKEVLPNAFNQADIFLALAKPCIKSPKDAKNTLFNMAKLEPVDKIPIPVLHA